VFVVLLIGLSAAVYILLKKYRTTKQRLDFEVNDIRNLASIPRTDAEMRVMTDKSKDKYTNLTADMDE
jgi:hypothetical protein